jgi:hypothetical protein
MTSAWISVKERLPEPYKDVLVFNAFAGFHIAQVDSFRGWVCRSLANAPHEVTYWQPLPEPPKNE